MPRIATNIIPNGMVDKMINNNQYWITSKAKWISMAGCQRKSNLYLQYANEFKISNPVLLNVRIAAVSRYVLYINGHYIGRGSVVSNRTYYYYETYKIPANYLIKGRNLISVLLHHDGKDTQTVQGFEYGEPGLLFGMEGEGVSYISDLNWKVKQSPAYSGTSIAGIDGSQMVSKWGGYKEFYHGDKEENWIGLMYDHSGWANAVEVADAISEEFVQNLVELDLPSLETTDIYPKRIIEISQNLGRISLESEVIPQEYHQQTVAVGGSEYGSSPAITFDFGRMVVGYPEINTEGGFCIYELWYGESLDIYRLDVVRVPTHGQWKAFQRRAFRFLQIKFIAIESEVRVKCVKIENSWYPYNTSGCAISSDITINNIIDISKYTVRVNTSYHYEDCPWREQALWIFDMRVMSLINYYNFGDAKLVAKNIHQIFALQYDDGSVNSTGPKLNNCWHIDFCMHLISALREYYQYSGDDSLVRELLPNVRRLAEYIKSYSSSDGILDSGPVGKRGAPFLDWSDKVDKLGESIILNAIYSRYLDDLAILYDLCECDGDALRNQRMQHSQSVNNLLFDKREGLYRDSFFDGKLSQKFSMQGNMAALYGGFVDAGKAAEILVKLSDKNRFHMPFAPSFYLIVFEALHQLDKGQTIMEHIKNYWGGMLDRGATAWWEVFDPNSPQWMYPHPFLGNTPTYEMDWIPVSSCHGWSGIPGYAIPRYLLGIDLFELYKNRITIQPRFAGAFERFTYKLPVRGEQLWIEFGSSLSGYQTEIKSCPKDVDILII
jgi:hypothetical protein